VNGSTPDDGLPLRSHVSWRANDPDPLVCGPEKREHSSADVAGAQESEPHSIEQPAHFDERSAGDAESRLATPTQIAIMATAGTLTSDGCPDQPRKPPAFVAQGTRD